MKTKSNQLLIDTISETINSPNISIYQKPKTSLFLEKPTDIHGGSGMVPESDAGALFSS